MKALALILIVATQAQGAPSRLKELVAVQGQRENALYGYGLVVGLTGTGDTEQVLFTSQSVSGMLGRLGVRVDPRDVRSRNVAAVMVTAKLATFSRAGTTLDVTVSAMGNARSLAGGTLLMTPLTGADGQVYAVAQGPVQAGGYEASIGATSIRKNQPTSGRVPNGATVEKAVIPNLTAGPLVLELRRPDFTNASRIAQAVEKTLGAGSAKALDAAAVQVEIPEADKANPVALLSKLELLEVEADVRAKVVVSERTGTVVMGERVRLRPAAISHGALRVAISQTVAVSQANPFANQGRTVLAPNNSIQADEPSRLAVAVPSTATVDDLVKALNALGASARDLVAILQALSAAGAIDAELEVL